MKRLLGAKILEIREDDPNDTDVLLKIKTDKGTMNFIHQQECCEDVYLESGLDELLSMIDQTILSAEEVEGESGNPYDGYGDSYTWTFYKISTKDYDCTLRFYGESNGYYSEDVELKFIID